MTDSVLRLFWFALRRNLTRSVISGLYFTVTLDGVVVMVVVRSFSFLSFLPFFSSSFSTISVVPGFSVMCSRMITEESRISK